jgi:hypothetical protein
MTARHRVAAATRTIFLAKGFDAVDRAAMREPPDPFGIADPCPYSATGQHDPISSCGDVVCCHCSKVF